MDISWITLMDMDWISFRILQGYLYGYCAWILMDMLGYLLNTDVDIMGISSMYI
jgi:hypothetical protein